MRTPISLATLFTVATTALPAMSQEVGFAVNRFEPAERGADWFSGESLDFAAKNRVVVGAIADYLHRPLAAYREDGSVAASIVRNDLLIHVGAAWVLLERLRLALELPLQAYTDGEDGVVGGTRYAAPPKSQGIGDVRVSADVRLFGDYRGPITGAVGVQMWAPTGDRAQYLSDGSVRFAGRAMVAGAMGAFEYSARVGSTYRYLSQQLDGGPVGSELVFGATAGARVAKGKVLVGPELYGTTVFEDPFAKRATPVEAILGAHWQAAPAWRFGAGAGTGLTRGFGAPVFRALLSAQYVPPAPLDTDGDGILDKDDACPSVRGLPSTEPSKHGCPAPVRKDTDKDGVFDDEDACVTTPGVRSSDAKHNGCPKDTDGDGILDSQDACVTVKGEHAAAPKTNGCPKDTDRDGILDTDDACVTEPGKPSEDPKQHGCPDPDRDKDSIANPVDACPDVAGKPNTNPARNGCPDATVEQGQIRVLDQVHFETASANIVQDDETKRVLGAVLTILKEHPEIQKLRVEGHTDARGSATYNRLLSKNRAAAVVRWLTAQGIDGKRLSSIGFGPDKPIASNDDEAGRQKNRRVEFHIEGGKDSVETAPAPTPSPATPASKSPSDPKSPVDAQPKPGTKAPAQPKAH